MQLMFTPAMIFSITNSYSAGPESEIDLPLFESGLCRTFDTDRIRTFFESEPKISNHTQRKSPLQRFFTRSLFLKLVQKPFTGRATIRALPRSLRKCELLFVMDTVTVPFRTNSTKWSSLQVLRLKEGTIIWLNQSSFLWVAHASSPKSPE